MRIPEKVKKLFLNQPLIAFSTADRLGFPNVVPIYWKMVVDEETLLLIDNYMKMTKENLQDNPKVCISFWDANTEEAYKVKGKAFYHVDGKIYNQGKEFIRLSRPEAKPKGAVEIRVEEIYTIKPGPEAGTKYS